jgi:bacterioferritin (cytochrome b1)
MGGRQRRTLRSAITHAATQIDAGSTEHFAHVAVTAQRTLKQASLVLVQIVLLTGKPAFKGVIMPTTQVKHLHGC